MTTPLSDVQAIAEVDRRLNREDPTALDRARLIARRKKLYDQLHPTNENPGASGPEPGETA